MQLTINAEENYSEIVIDGRVDATTAGQLDEVSTQTASDAKGAVLLNFTGVEYISSAGLRSVLKLAKLCQMKKLKLRCFGMQKAVFEVFKLSGFSSILTITDNKEAALDSIK